MTPPTPNFNAHHSPVGAYLTFTCGHHGTPGGLAAQLGKPANQDLFIGYKNAAPHTPAPLHVLPFFNNADKIDPAEAFLAPKPNHDRQTFSPLASLTRDYGWSTDRWKTPDNTLEFNIYSPFIDLPDPATAAPAEMQTALLPAITAELIIDNRTGATPKTGLFSINFQEAGNRILELAPTAAFPAAQRTAFAHRAHYGVAAELFDMTAKGSPPPVDPQESKPFAFLRWWPHEGLEDASNPVHLLGTTPGIAFEVPPGKRYTLRLALGCYLAGTVTTRLEGRYLYTRHYGNLEEVLNAALDRFCDLKQLAKSQDQQLANSGLSDDQQFLIAHATRSYYANTELLEVEGEPYWIVNEGEYCMMNTLDLAVDQVFWELERNPWVARNVLDGFLKRYSYTDEVKIKTTEGTENTETTDDGVGSSVHSVSSVVSSGFSLAPGGISFCHDQGTHNQFSPFGRSAYELRDLTGCFSFMTQEQLCNWILIASCYVASTKDRKWAIDNKAAIKACFASMVARADNFGIMAFDSDLCGSGSEITTYDSLDSSLGQARANLYLSVKLCAAYLGLEYLLFTAMEDDGAAWKMAGGLSEAIRGRANADGTLPAIFEAGALGHDARILPAVEGLVYWNWLYAAMHDGGDLKRALTRQHALTPFVGALERHVRILLSDSASSNRFFDGGIKLSSTSGNSWLSKIAIVQHVARSLFNLDENGNTRRDATPLNGDLGGERRVAAALKVGGEGGVGVGASGWERADAAHVRWLTTGPGAYWCACDQIVNGEAKGSKYYPRLITMALWLREVKRGTGDGEV